MPRTSLRREIAVRLGSAIALAVLVVAASVIALYLHVNRTVSAQQLVDALAHVRQNIAAFERDLQIDARDRKSTRLNSSH